LHSENIVLLDGEPVPFDCLEFREDLRWIDCASDVAFITMDLADRGYSRFAHRLLNRYIEQTGDPKALSVMRFYQAYRAVVRAVVTTLQQRPGLTKGQITDRARTYLQLAKQYLYPRRPALMITHGLSGSGKSTVTEELLEHMGAIRLRSDVERRRLDNGVPAVGGKERSLADRYSIAARQAVYDELLCKAEIGLAAGFSIIVDATFLQRGHRIAFRQLAAQRNVSFVILEFDADPATLRQRIADRQQAGVDLSEATGGVLEQQLAERERLGEEERKYVVAGGGDMRSTIERLHEHGLRKASEADD
jgi:predicted kinase